MKALAIVIDDSLNKILKDIKKTKKVAAAVLIRALIAESQTNPEVHKIIDRLAEERKINILTRKVELYQRKKDVIEKRLNDIKQKVA